MRDVQVNKILFKLSNFQMAAMGNVPIAMDSIAQFASKIFHVARQEATDWMANMSTEFVYKPSSSVTSACLVFRLSSGHLPMLGKRKSWKIYLSKFV